MMSDNKRPVTVEDLLRLKRSERAPAEFWEKFDRELRAKQLSALVSKRPWWQRVPDAFAGWRRYHLPIGATAVLAVTFLSLHDFRKSDLNSTEPVAGGAQVAAAPGVDESALPISSPSTFSPAALDTATASAAGATRSGGAPISLSSTEDSAFAVAAEPAPRESVPPTAVLSGLVSPGASLAPSARHIAANLAAVSQVVDTPLTQPLLSSAQEARVIAARTASQEPLAQMNPPSATRASRLRTAMAMMIANDSLVRANERMARGLGDDRLNEEAIRRVAYRGDAVSLKF